MVAHRFELERGKAFVSHLISCRQATSGEACLNQASTVSTRALTELTLKVAIFMGGRLAQALDCAPDRQCEIPTDVDRKRSAAASADFRGKRGVGRVQRGDAIWHALSASDVGRDRRRTTTSVLRSRSWSPASRPCPRTITCWRRSTSTCSMGRLTLRLGDEDLRDGAGRLCLLSGGTAGRALPDQQQHRRRRYIIVGEQNKNEVIVYTDFEQSAGPLARPARDLRPVGHARLLGRRKDDVALKVDWLGY